MRVPELKSGMIVRLRNNGKRIVIGRHDNMVTLAAIHVGIYEIEYDALLKNSADKSQDIMRVFIPTSKTPLFLLLDPTDFEDLKLIWERPEIVEVTMQEVADKFGIPLEELRIK